ncbi:MAG: TIGR01244 family sulfur transferase [Pseudomonadota bacterium]
MQSERGLNDKVSVAPQISLDAIDGLAAEGFTTLILNRPDFESPDQPSTAEVGERAKRAGLRFVHIPIAGGQFSQDAIDEFRRELGEASGRVLAYCLSGTRSACLWALSEAPRLGTEAVLDATAGAGYNIEPLRPLIDAQSQITDGN